jgi:hypothetical protein
MIGRAIKERPMRDVRGRGASVISVKLAVLSGSFLPRLSGSRPTEIEPGSWSPVLAAQPRAEVGLPQIPLSPARHAYRIRRAAARSQRAVRSRGNQALVLDEGAVRNPAMSNLRRKDFSSDHRHSSPRDFRLREAAIRILEEINQAAAFLMATPPQLFGSVRAPNANPRRF